MPGMSALEEMLQAAGPMTFGPVRALYVQPVSESSGWIFGNNDWGNLTNVFPPLILPRSDQLPDKCSVVVSASATVHMLPVPEVKLPWLMGCLRIVDNLEANVIAGKQFSVFCPLDAATNGGVFSIPVSLEGIQLRRKDQMTFRVELLLKDTTRAIVSNRTTIVPQATNVDGPALFRAIEFGPAAS
jgi:hypothetical protein